MQELSRYAVGLDIGTTAVRCVVGHVDNGAQTPTIIGTGYAENSGMRKGVVVKLTEAAQAIDKALEEAERMSGHHIQGATVSINGSHITGMSSRGVIAVGAQGHEINQGDLDRIQEAATVVQLPANREILEVAARSYQLDGQENIKDPLGMTGVRLEVDAYVITALGPHLKTLHKAMDMSDTAPHNTVVAGLAAARAVLSEQQKENGVVLIDIGGTTTNIAVYEEGDLMHVAVIPMGGVSITNDLAIGLKTDLDIAEQTKLKHAVAASTARKKQDGTVTVKMEKDSHEFAVSEIDMIVEARLEEIFERVNKELKKIGRAAKLPGGVVVTGGTARLNGIADYARDALQLAARVGTPSGFSGVAENIDDSAYATALGLMLLEMEGTSKQMSSAKQRKHPSSGGLGKTLKGVFDKFRA